MRGELVAAVGDRDDQARVLGFLLNLATQADNLHVDAAVKGLGITAGQQLQQLVARQYPSRPLHKDAQQAELAMRQLHLLARCIQQAVAAEVQEVSAKLQHGFGGFRFERPKISASATRASSPSSSRDIQ